LGLCHRRPCPGGRVAAESIPATTSWLAAETSHHRAGHLHAQIKSPPPPAFAWQRRHVCRNSAELAAPALQAVHSARRRIGPVPHAT
jgi:hypothetical protein